MGAAFRSIRIQNSQKIGPRSHHDDAACGRQIRPENLSDLGRLAWGRHFGRQCAVGTPRSGGRAQSAALPPDFRAGPPETPLEKLGKVQNRRGTSVRFKPDEKIFGKGAHFKPARLFKMARSKAYLFGGVEIRWHCAPEWLDPDGSDSRRGRLPVSRRPQGLPPPGHRGQGARHRSDFCRQDREGRRPRIARMGHGLARLRRWLRPLLLQYHSDPRRRNP